VPTALSTPLDPPCELTEPSPALPTRRVMSPIRGIAQFNTAPGSSPRSSSRQGPYVPWPTNIDLPVVPFPAPVVVSQAAVPIRRSQSPPRRVFQGAEEPRGRSPVRLLQFTSVAPHGMQLHQARSRSPGHVVSCVQHSPRFDHQVLPAAGHVSRGRLHDLSMGKLYRHQSAGNADYPSTVSCGSTMVVQGIQPHVASRHLGQRDVSPISTSPRLPTMPVLPVATPASPRIMLTWHPASAS